MNAPTLTELFNSQKEELAEKLRKYSLPRDSKEVQSTVSAFLDNMFEDEGSYRQNLTQSEDYILQAALAMLNAQREMVSAFDVTPQFIVKESIEISEALNDKEFTNSNSTLNQTKTLIGVGGGAVVGKLIFGGWGAVFGAIAGTAIALYLSQQPKKTTTQSKGKLSSGTPKVEIVDTPINVDALMSVISQICNSLDNLIATFRAQIQRVINKYESQEKPTIERDFRVLLEGIQSLIGYKRGHSPEEEKYLLKLQTCVEDLAELLDNYDLEAIDYTPDHANWFEAIESKNATEIKMVNPAIIKDGNLILRGKIFIPLAER